MRDLFIQDAGFHTMVGEVFVDRRGERRVRYLMRTALTRSERKRLDELIRQMMEPYVAEEGSRAFNNGGWPRTPELRQELEELVRSVEIRSGVDFWRAQGLRLPGRAPRISGPEPPGSGSLRFVPQRLPALSPAAPTYGNCLLGLVSSGGPAKFQGRISHSTWRMRFRNSFASSPATLITGVPVVSK